MVIFNQILRPRFLFFSLLMSRPNSEYILVEWNLSLAKDIRVKSFLKCFIFIN
jgi:hypothetical protein